MKTYVFLVGRNRETIDLPGEYDLEAAKRAIKARFPGAQVSFQAVEKTVLEEATPDTRIQEPGYGPWK